MIPEHELAAMRARMELPGGYTTFSYDQLLHLLEAVESLSEENGRLRTALTKEDLGKLLVLAEWLDVKDQVEGKEGSEVQTDLRNMVTRFAAALEGRGGNDV